MFSLCWISLPGPAFQLLFMISPQTTGLSESMPGRPALYPKPPKIKHMIKKWGKPKGVKARQPLSQCLGDNGECKRLIKPGTWCIQENTHYLALSRTIYIYISCGYQSKMNMQSLIHKAEKEGFPFLCDFSYLLWCLLIAINWCTPWSTEIFAGFAVTLSAPRAMHSDSLSSVPAWLSLCPGPLPLQGERWWAGLWKWAAENPPGGDKVAVGMETAHKGRP